MFNKQKGDKGRLYELLGLFAIRMCAYSLCYETKANDNNIGKYEAYNFYKANLDKDGILLNNLSAFTWSDFEKFLHGESEISNFKCVEGDKSYYINNSLNVKESKAKGYENTSNVIIKINNIDEITNQNIDNFSGKNSKNIAKFSKCEYYETKYKDLKTSLTEEDKNKEYDITINDSYGGELNDMLRLFPFNRDNYNRIINIKEDNWGTDTIKKDDDLFGNINLDTLKTDFNATFDNIKQFKYDNNGNNLYNAYNFLRKLDISCSAPYKDNTSYSNNSMATYDLRSEICCESLLTMLKIGASYYFNTRQMERPKYREGANMILTNGETILISEYYRSKEHVDNLKQLFYEWATSTPNKYRNILCDNPIEGGFSSICFKNMYYTENGETKISEYNIKKLGEINLLCFATGREKDKNKIFNLRGYANLRNCFNNFKETLNKLYGVTDTLDAFKDTAYVEDKDTKNDELKCAIYYTLKNFYDKWMCSKDENDFKLPENAYLKSIKNEEKRSIFEINGTKEYDRMVFVDEYLGDISNSMVIDMSTMKTIIESTLGGDGSFSMFQMMHELASRNGCLFLTVPVFNNKSIDDIFKPYNIYNNINGGDVGSKYIVLFRGDTSKILDSGDEDGSFINDGFDIANMFGNVNSEAEDVFSSNGFAINAFGVTYGLQNQNYFKNINIGMDNHTQTDYSIANTLMLADGGRNGDLNSSVFLNNSIYPIYANRSYECNIEMMGNVAITPLMYFQLNNVPMFRGAYVITNVTHKIVPGNFTTTFTGVRIPKWNIEPLKNVIAIDDFINRCGTGQIIDRKEVHEMHSKDYEKLKLNNNINVNSFETAEDIATISNIRDNNDKPIIQYVDDRIKNNTKCVKKSLKKFINNLSNAIKNCDDMNDMSVLITSSLRNGENDSRRSHHYYGFAVDMQGTIRGSKVVDPTKTAKLFKFIIANKEIFRADIDQIIWETHSNKGQTFSSASYDLPNVIHVSTANVAELESDKQLDTYKQARGIKLETAISLKRAMVIQSYIKEDYSNVTIKGNENPEVTAARVEWS